jgi:peptidylprolyl isomerase
MSRAKNGDTVKVEFTGRLENGEVFTKPKEDEPFEFTIGKEQVILGFERAVIGMEVGETNTVTVPPEEAYGPRYEDLLVKIKRTNLPHHITPVIGKRLQIPQKDGNPIRVTISDINENTITLDANHPLAGITLTFDIELVAVI